MAGVMWMWVWHVKMDAAAALRQRTCPSSSCSTTTAISLHTLEPAPRFTSKVNLILCIVSIGITCSIGLEKSKILPSNIRV